MEVLLLASSAPEHPLISTASPTLKISLSLG